ncbi:unnamed protein product, partial [marine sediment metagenome]
MNKKLVILVLVILLIVVSISLISFASAASSDSYSINSYHTGLSGEKANTSSFDLRATTTYQQPGDDKASSESYSLSAGWLGYFITEYLSADLNITFIVPVKTCEGPNAECPEPDSPANCFYTNSSGSGVWPGPSCYIYAEE